MSTDAGRNELFGNAAQRQQPSSQPSGAYGAAGQSGAYGATGGYGQPSGGYGAYNDRELTAEEQEEEDINATKNEIKFMKQQDVSSTRNALRLAQQAEETGRDTLARLGAQGERIHNTERNLDLASSQNRIAEEKARELKTLNKSMFAMHVSNPFTASSRREERDAKIMETHRQERDQRDASRKAAWDSAARSDGFNREMQGMNGGAKKNQLWLIEPNISLKLIRRMTRWKMRLTRTSMPSMAPRSVSTTLAVQWDRRLIPRTNTLIASPTRQTRWTTRSP